MEWVFIIAINIFFTNYRFLTFKISTLGFSFLVLSGLRPVWRVSVGNSCCHPVLDAALGLQLDQILLVGQLSRCRLLIQPQSSFCCSSTQCFVPIWPDPRDFQFHLGVSLSPVYFGDRLSCFLISLLWGFLVLVPCSHSHNGNCTKVYIFSTLYHIAPIQNLLIFLHQLPSNCTLYCKKQNKRKLCQ